MIVRRNYYVANAVVDVRLLGVQISLPIKLEYIFDITK
jgi:hypothetical protein